MPSLQRIQLVTRDGKTGAATSVNEWVPAAQELPAPTLFFVDLCRAGKVANLPRTGVLPDDEVKAWVIAASRDDEDTSTAGYLIR